MQITIGDIERIEGVIREVRGQRVLLDYDLARFHGVETRVLNQTVKRHPERFPDDFTFQLSQEEAAAWVRSRSHCVILKRGENLRHRPHAFTEQGVAMLASVLHNDRAAWVNVEILRAFVRLRRRLATHAALVRKIEALETKYDARLQVVFAALQQLMESAENQRREVGFHVRREDRKPGGNN